MTLFKRRDHVDSAAMPAPEPKPVKVEKKEEPPDPMFRPLEPEPPGTPPQRGTISDRQVALLRMQLQIADTLRQRFLAPAISLDLPLERTPELEKTAREKLQQLISSGNCRLPSNTNQDDFVNDVLNEAFGYGPIQSLIERTDITEIMVNGPYIIFVEKNGRVRETGYKFLDDDHVERIVKRIVLPLGRTVSIDTPLIDARLPDGSRVNAVIRPCAIDGPNMTIRKFSKDKLTVNDLIRFGSLTEDMARLLEAAVVSRRNIIVSGGTGSGKTTLINILSGYIPEHERTVTIEDAAELQLRQRNVVRLETKKPNPISPTEISIRQCVINALPLDLHLDDVAVGHRELGVAEDADPFRRAGEDEVAGQQGEGA